MLYHSAGTFDEIRELTRAILNERGLLNKFVRSEFAAGKSHTIISGDWISATQQNIVTAFVRLEEAAKREAEAARQQGDEARAKEIRREVEELAVVA